MSPSMAPLVIAHRGATDERPENTLAAFEQAIEIGSDAIEFDIQATSDGALVVFHDDDLDRLTGARWALRKRTLAEVRSLRVGGEQIPTLDEALELAAGRIIVMPELKSPHLFRRHDLVARTLGSLTAHGFGPEDAIVVSFSAWGLGETRRLAPELRRVQNVGYGVSIRQAAGTAWAVGIEDRSTTPHALALARSLGLATLVWTVNDAARMRELAGLGVDGIFTDRPALLRTQLSRST
jgi:glycerophosphoryl diester phosphodiesterase